MNKAKLIIWGCGGMGREILALCEVLGREVIGYLDERIEMQGQIIDEVPVLGDITHVAKYRNEAEIICTGVGEPTLKRRFAFKTREAGFRLADSLVHPSVHVPRSSQIGVNSVLCAGTIVSINVNIGDFVIVNTNVTLAHDVSVSDYCTISPGANISGNVTVEEGVFIGTGSAIREKLTLGAWSLVGGGSFVKNDVPPQTLYAGVPAIYKKTRTAP
ncbi:acetyltransferase [Paenibacillus lentus]|uniref:Acetyltransferase n=1 Tax=Paenibacillus lentus TaxID=1338368 RepID=A0A3S8RXS0_9BACL|nr:acetyltransferase [Paenibacillus lentus]AZK47587.1 acetyltransferase [Paenibacillus lentus]